MLLTACMKAREARFFIFNTTTRMAARMRLATHAISCSDTIFRNAAER